jgi:hypothetical protein
MGRFFDHSFLLMLTLKKAGEYSRIIRILQPMMPTILSKGTISTLCQLLPPPLDLVPSPIFDYKPKHTFILDRVLFTQALAIVPHLSLGGLSKMVYECFLACFILKDPFLAFSKLF